MLHTTGDEESGRFNLRRKGESRVADERTAALATGARDSSSPREGEKSSKIELEGHRRHQVELYSSEGWQNQKSRGRWRSRAVTPDRGGNHVKGGEKKGTEKSGSTQERGLGLMLPEAERSGGQSNSACGYSPAAFSNS